MSTLPLSDWRDPLRIKQETMTSAETKANALARFRIAAVALGEFGPLPENRARRWNDEVFISPKRFRPAMFDVLSCSGLFERGHCQQQCHT